MAMLLILAVANYYMKQDSYIDVNHMVVDYLFLKHYYYYYQIHQDLEKYYLYLKMLIMVVVVHLVLVDQLKLEHNFPE
jgi:hypothetical protein